MELQDNKMKELLSYGKLKLPFADFEDNMLQKIQEYELKKKAAEKNKFWSHLCFLLGLILGGILTYSMSSDLDDLIPLRDVQDKLVSVIQLFYVLLIVLFADKLWKLFKMDFKKLFK